MLPANVMGVGGHISPVILPNSAALMVPTPGVTGLPAMHATAVPAAYTILTTCQPTLNMGSIVPASPNMPPTLVPPVLPQLNMMGIPTILVMCLPATTITSPAISAGPPGLTAIPNVVNVFLMYASASEAATGTDDPRVTLESLRALAQSLAGPKVEATLLDEGVALLSIRAFSGSVPSDVFHQLKKLQSRGMTSLLVDLRGNPGGEMEAMIQLAADFLDEGQLIMTLTDTDGDDDEHRVQKPGLYSCPVALLVDAGTASAAEVFAGCLQAHRRAVVVGARTYGKGEAQEAVGSAAGLIYTTVATAKLPDGRSIQGLGVEPDIPSPVEDRETWRANARRLPPSLARAIETLCVADA